MREAVVRVEDSDFDAVGLGELVEHCRAAGLRDLAEIACHGDGGIVLAEVEERLDEARLDGFECVDHWELLAAEGETWLYLVAITAPELPEELADRAEELVGTCDPMVDEGGLTMSLTGPQDAIRDAIAEYEDAGVSVSLRKLGSYDGVERPLDALTRRQREVIQTAYDRGYYEVPREVSTADVAAELDLDPSTVAEHLQRAERNLLGQHLSASG